MQCVVAPHPPVALTATRAERLAGSPSNERTASRGHLLRHYCVRPSGFALTRPGKVANVFCMRLRKSALVAVVALLLAAYVFDCHAMSSTEQATQCCGSMPCSPQGHHDQECCQTMPTMRGPFVKPSAIQVSFAVTLAVLPITRQPRVATPELSRTTSVAQTHFSPPAITPLRI